MSRRIFLAAILGIACAIAPVSAEAQYYGLTNVAKGRPVTALTPSAIGVPQNVTDGKGDTYWFSYFLQEYTIDLGAAIPIGKIVVYATQGQDIVISSSLDGTTFTPRHSFNSTDAQHSNWIGGMLYGQLTFKADGTYSARYLKYHSANVGCGCYQGTHEFAVYPWVATPPPVLSGANLAMIPGTTVTNDPPYVSVSGFPPSNVADGNTTTLWKGNHQTWHTPMAGQQLGTIMGRARIDLGAELLVYGARVRRPAGGGAQAVSVSLYNNANQEIAWFGDGDPNVVSSTNPGVGDVDFVLDMPVQARYVRVWQVNSLVHATTEYPALAEVEVYGETAQNSAPVANAGADQTVYVGNTVTLDGSGSTDVDGDLLTYSWAFTTKPDGSTATLSGTTTVNPTFTVDKAGTYVVSLIVNDGTVDSTADTVTISTLNSAPVADAGTDQTPYVNDTVTLNGSGSYDVDGNLLTYSWAFTSKPADSTATLSDATAVNPTFTVDKAGTYVVSLIVNDGTVNSAADTVTISTLNSAPVANAGADQTAYVTNTVTLDGSGSSDVDGNLLTYTWAFTTVPAGSSAALSSSTSVNPTFTVDKAGTYVVSLIVNDGTVNSAADTVTISTLNSAPVANAGADQTPYVNDTVTLNGSNSYDVDGNLLTYSWAFTTVPQGSAASLVNPTSVNPTFTVDKAGTYVVSLIVNDGTVNSAADTVTISTLNSAPVANAGLDQSVYVGNTVTLDGSGSSDVDGDVLTYSWSFTSRPSGSTAALNDTTSANPTFTVDKAGTYVASLIVNDGTVNSAPDTITISTINVAPVANAGNDQTVPEESTVTLDGSGSSDADGNALTYSWAFTTKPTESTAILSGTTTMNPTFTADEEGTYVVSLIVNDGTVNSSPDTVTITANEAPEEEIEVEVSIKPETINLKSKGKFKAFIELPEPYSADEVVLATVVCEGAHAIDGRVDGEDRYIATFNTQDLRITVSSKEEEVTITVTGELEDGTKFTGSDTVKVKGK